MRVGLVGAGNMMQITHLPSLLQIAEVELAGLAELDRARAEKTGGGVSNTAHLRQR